MVRVILDRIGERYSVSEAGYYLTWVYMPVENNKKQYFILPCSEFEKRPDFFKNPDDYILMKKFISDSRELLSQQNINIKEYLYNGNSE